MAMQSAVQALPSVNSSDLQQRRRSSTAASSIPHDSSHSITSQHFASASSGFTPHISRRSGNRSRKSSGSNVGSTEILGGTRYAGLRRQMSTESPLGPQNVVHIAIKHLKEERRWTVTDPYQRGSETTNDKAWKECTEAAIRAVESHCRKTLEQIQQLKFTALCVCSLLVCIRLWVSDANPSSNWLGDISADNPAALCILFSSLSLSFLQIAERWTHGCTSRISLSMDQSKLFVLVQRRKYYMQYGVIPLLLSIAHGSADIAMWILLGIILGKIGNIGRVWGGTTAMMVILAVKAGSVVCPTIKFLRTTPALSSPFQSWLVSVLEFIFTSWRASHASPTTSSQITNQHEKLHKKIERLTHNWKLGMGFGSDLELCVPGLLELVTSQRCKVTDVITCLCDFSKAYPHLLIHDIWKLARGLDIASHCSTKGDLVVDIQDAKDTEAFARDFLIALFLRQAASVEEQFDNSRSMTRLRTELFCRLFNSSLDNPKALAMAISIFTLSKTFQKGLISGSRAGKFDHAFTDCLTQLLRVATVALEKDIILADLNNFLEELIPSLLATDAVLSVRVGGGITAFTAVWANSIANDDRGAEQFYRYRTKLKALRSGENYPSHLLSEVELALEYKKDRVVSILSC